MFTYEVTDNPPMSKVFSNGNLIDQSGPWDSVESAETWAEAYTNGLNEGTITPQ
jgi:hypothetical protein